MIEIESAGALVALLLLAVALMAIRDRRRSLDAVRSAKFWNWK